MPPIQGANSLAASGLPARLRRLRRGVVYSVRVVRAACRIGHVSESTRRCGLHDDSDKAGTVKLTARRNIKDKEADSPSLVGHPIVFLKLLRERSSPLSRWQILTSSLLDNLPLNINVALVGSANR